MGYIAIEVGSPPNTKLRQNSLNRLCSVCAVNFFCLCCFVFLDIKIIFIGHSEVTPPPPQKKTIFFVCAASVFKILDIEL